MPTQFLNLVRFPVPLEFKNQALGLRRKIVVGSLTGAICLPTENIAKIEENSGLRRPRVRDIEWALKVFDHRRAPHEHLQWGKYFTWNRTNPAATAVASIWHAAVCFSAVQVQGTKSLSEIAAESHRQIPQWHTRLKEWIEVLTKDDLDAAHPLKSVEVPELITVPWTFRKNRKKEYEYMNPMVVVRAGGGGGALDETLWSSAIRAANKGLHPSEERILLRDARAALRRNNYRRTVLDAATATELLIEPALRRLLLRTNKVNVVDHLLRQGWQFRWRRDMMLKLGMWLPQDIDQKLMNVRNGVIHENAAVTPKEARDALDLAEQLANHYQPLKPP